MDVHWPDESYIDDVREYVLQTFLDEWDPNELFINQFIDLIDQIQTTMAIQWM